MKLTKRTSGTTVIVSPTRSAPRPEAPARPVQHGASIEVAAALDERDAGRELTRPPPRDDRGVVALHPLAIRDRDIDRRSTERMAPLDHGAVEMRMRERDAADPALRADPGDGLVIDVADAVPEDV